MKSVVIHVDSSARIRKEQLTEEVSDALKNAFIFTNPDFNMKQMLKLPGWWKEPKEVGTWGEDKFDLIIPRGGMRKIREVLQEHGVPFQIVDDRVEGGTVNKFPEYIGPEIRYYQEEAIQAALRRENCVLRMPTGSGKSLMAIALATRVKLNTLVILPTVGLFKQWSDDAKMSLNIGPDDLGIIHQKKRKLRPITATVQGTLAAQGVDEELQEYFGMIIVDEVQKCAARTYMMVVGAFPSRYRIGISADERRKDRKEFLTNGLFGGVEYEKKRKELEQEGFIVDVEIRVVPTDFEAPWYGLPKDGEEDKTVDFNRLLEEMTSDEARNKLALKFAFEEAEKGEQVLVLSHRREHCIEIDREFVKRGIRSGFFIGGGDYETEFANTRAGILDGSVRAGIGTYGALGVGVNLPAVSVGIAHTPLAGNRFAFNQGRGRFNRTSKDKKSARMYVLWDRYVYPGHLKNLIEWNPTVKVYDQGRWVEAKGYQNKWQAKLKKKKITYGFEEEHE